VVENEVRTGGQEPFYMETHSVRVVPTGEDGEIDVYCGVQMITEMQVNISWFSWFFSVLFVCLFVCLFVI